MPNYFSLTLKSEPESEPVDLIKVDEMICEHFGVKPDDHKYYESWYDLIGLELACGKSFHDLMSYFDGDARLVEIVAFLEETFVARGWYSAR